MLVWSDPRSHDKTLNLLDIKSVVCEEQHDWMLLWEPKAAISLFDYQNPHPGPKIAGSHNALDPE